MMKKNHDPNFEHHQKLHAAFLNDLIALQLKGTKEHKNKMTICFTKCDFVAFFYSFVFLSYSVAEHSPSPMGQNSR